MAKDIFLGGVGTLLAVLLVGFMGKSLDQNHDHALGWLILIVIVSVIFASGAIWLFG